MQEIKGYGTRELNQFVSEYSGPDTVFGLGLGETKELRKKLHGQGGIIVTVKKAGAGARGLRSMIAKGYYLAGVPNAESYANNLSAFRFVLAFPVGVERPLSMKEKIALAVDTLERIRNGASKVDGSAHEAMLFGIKELAEKALERITK